MYKGGRAASVASGPEEEGRAGTKGGVLNKHDKANHIGKRNGAAEDRNPAFRIRTKKLQPLSV